MEAEAATPAVGVPAGLVDDSQVGVPSLATQPECIVVDDSDGETYDAPGQVPRDRRTTNCLRVLADGIKRASEDDDHSDRKNGAPRTTSPRMMRV